MKARSVIPRTIQAIKTSGPATAKRATSNEKSLNQSQVIDHYSVSRHPRYCFYRPELNLRSDGLPEVSRRGGDQVRSGGRVRSRRKGAGQRLRKSLSATRIWRIEATLTRVQCRMELAEGTNAGNKSGVILRGARRLRGPPLMGETRGTDGPSSPPPHSRVADFTPFAQSFGIGIAVKTGIELSLTPTPCRGTRRPPLELAN